MNKEKLYNSIYKYLIKKYINKYKIQEFCYLYYCCRGEDNPCWFDVKGMNYGWIFVNKTEDKTKKNLIKVTLYELKNNKDILYDRKIIMAQDENCILFKFSLRDKVGYDFSIMLKIK